MSDEKSYSLCRDCVFKVFLTEGPVKLMQRVKTAYSFLQYGSNLSHFIILKLPM